MFGCRISGIFRYDFAIKITFFFGKQVGHDGSCICIEGTIETHLKSNVISFVTNEEFS